MSAQLGVVVKERHRHPGIDQAHGAPPLHLFGSAAGDVCKIQQTVVYGQRLEDHLRSASIAIAVVSVPSRRPHLPPYPLANQP